MGEFSKWLLHEDQKELFDYLFAIFLNAVFLAITALLLWPLGKAAMIFQLAKGFWIFWTAVIVTASLLVLAQRIFRMDLYSRFDAYVISGLAVSGFVQVGWSAFAAPVIRSFVIDTPVWMVIMLYVVGVLSCYVACVIVGAFYMGGLYRMVNPILAIVSFIVFSVWPTAGIVIYSWFFNLFWK
ncbi:MAG TPA: hypothetical protein VJM50_06515 [Pyrinomonadaceae bacterium]|nr:hypothetical protein [Pyrinomonadaceae bacterium]